MAECPVMVGRYEIIREIGRGGMGVVYLARDPALDRQVAVKTLFQTAWQDDDAKERFLREARSAARLQHPNIITIFELGESHSTPFIAMELLHGVDLTEAIRKGRFSRLEDKLSVISQLCRGLAHAHRQGVIHRDVKPSNIIILNDGRIKIVDFGIARFDGAVGLTRTGEVMGTPTFMAPEQFTEEKKDHRMDIWAVGVILFELISGKRPFDAETVGSLIYRIVHADMPSLESTQHEVSAGLIAVVRRALAKKPEDRYADLADLERDLEKIRPGNQPEIEETEELQLPISVVPASEPFLEAGIFGDSAGLHSVAVSPDEKTLAVGGIDGSIRLWDLETRMKTATLRSRLHLRTGHAALTKTLAYSRDGGFLATGHLDGQIYLWQPDIGLELEATLRHDEGVTGLGFTPDADLLVSSGMDATVKFWEMSAVLVGEARRRMRRQPAPITTLAVDPEGVFAASGHVNGSLRIHDIENGRLLATLRGHTSPLSVLSVSPATGLIVSGGRDGEIRVFSLEKRAQVIFLEGHGRTVSSIAFFPDGRRLASVALSNSLIIWDLESGREITTLWGAAEESFATVSVLNRGATILCGLADGRVRVWEI
ncbi:MAG: serine/threonine protein kinase [Thermoanaerobaculales bacterium]|nr:serine/threonine protein kinase [Thermoanaerobaculales bacterium]